MACSTQSDPMMQRTGGLQLWTLVDPSNLDAPIMPSMSCSPTSLRHLVNILSSRMPTWNSPKIGEIL